MGQELGGGKVKSLIAVVVIGIDTERQGDKNHLRRIKPSLNRGRLFVCW